MDAEKLFIEINRLLPGTDLRSYCLRRVLRVIALDGGTITEASLRAVLGEGSLSLAEARTWDGCRWSEDGWGPIVALAPWVRKALGLPVESAELLADLGPEPGVVEGSQTSSSHRFVKVRLEDLSPATPERLAELTAERRARTHGYDSDPCPCCHQWRIVHSGDLHVCDSCGHRWAEPADRFAEVCTKLTGCKNIATADEIREKLYPDVVRVLIAE